MGGIHSVRRNHKEQSGNWSSKDGCDHIDENTTISTLQWKIVPMTKDEKKVVLRRIMTLTGSASLESAHGLNKKEADSSQEVIECMYHCKECKQDKFITFELLPEGSKIRNGRYTKVTKILKTFHPSSLTVDGVRSAYNDERELKYDILDGNKSSRKFCQFIWDKSINV